ncbi:MAG: hypothetical protein F6K39_08990 [Okeania sp. SIO3B3]|nr:hypothetical protein [Okeania sp. SIO3B3]
MDISVTRSLESRTFVNSLKAALLVALMALAFVLFHSPAYADNCSEGERASIPPCAAVAQSQVVDGKTEIKVSGDANLENEAKAGIEVDNTSSDYQYQASVVSHCSQPFTVKFDLAWASDKTTTIEPSGSTELHTSHRIQQVSCCVNDGGCSQQ